MDTVNTINANITIKTPRKMFPDKPKYASSTWYRHNVPDYNDKHKEWSRKSIQKSIEKDPEGWKKKKRDEKNDKYKNDPEFAEKRRQASKAYYHKKKAEKEQAQLEQLEQIVGVLLNV